MTPDERTQRCGEAELGPLHEAAAKVTQGCAFPVDHSREAPAIAALARRGYTAEFVVDGSRLRVANTDRGFPPEQLRIRDYYRFEGTSDPDDMSVIYALEARDGTRGTLTDAYGAYADPAVGAAVGRMRVEPLGVRHRWRRALAGAALGALMGAAATVLLTRRRAA